MAQRGTDDVAAMLAARVEPVMDGITVDILSETETYPSVFLPHR